MKKLVSLAVVLILIVCLATTAFAAEFINDASVPTNVNLAAGASVEYEVRAFGMTMTITNAVNLTVTVNGEPCTADGNGVITYAMPNGHPMMTPPAVISLTNNSAAAVESVMSFAYPVGTSGNPEVLTIGSNTANASGEGYFYTYTATEGGVLVLEMSGENWVVSINNLTTYIFGDAVWASDGVTYAAAAVAPGDEIQVVIGTEDWTAAQISFTASIEEHIFEHVLASDPGCHTNGYLEHWYCQYCDCYFVDVEGNLQNTASKNVIIPAPNTLEHHEFTPNSCVNDGNWEYWYCEGCDCFFIDAEGKYNTAYLNMVIPADGESHYLEYHEAQESSCHRNGNVEYYYCSECDCYFIMDDEYNLINTNAKSVLIPAEVTLQYNKAVDVTCVNDGMLENWYCSKCDCYFIDSQGIFNIARLSLVIPADGTDHVLEHHTAADPVCHKPGNVEYWYCSECDCYFVDVEGNLVNTNAKSVMIPAAETLEYHKAVAPTCVDDGMAEYWYCDACDCYFTDFEGKYNIARLSLVIPADGTDHDLEHHAAADPYCHRNGNVEYWYCGECDCYFTKVEGNLVNTNAKNVLIPAEETLEYHKKVDATCVKDGMEEYWYCAECDCYFTDAQGIFNIASKRLVIEADGTDHVLEHHAAADPVCHKNGNVEYWYCAECDCYFIEVEGNKVNTNAKNVVILAEETLKHTAKVDATCTENGMLEHWYCENCDCYFTDAEGKFNIARLSLVIPAAGHNYVNGECTECGSDNPQTGDAGFMGAVATMLASAMSTVALVIKKKEF